MTKWNGHANDIDDAWYVSTYANKVNKKVRKRRVNIGVWQLAQDMSDKPLDNNELAFQNFIIYGFERAKPGSMIYGVSKSKGEGLRYHKKPYNPMTNVLVQPWNISPLNYARKGLYAYFMPATEKGKILN